MQPRLLIGLTARRILLFWLFDNTGYCFEQAFLPACNENRSTKLTNQRCHFLGGVKGKHSHCAALVFNLTANNIAVGELKR